MSNSSTESVGIRSRFDSILHSLQTNVDELNSAKLFGVWDHEFPKLLKNIVKNFRKDLEDNVFTLDSDEKDSALETMNHRLDYLVSQLDMIVNTLCKNSALHEFVSFILRDLGVAKTIPYLICIRQSPATFPILQTCEEIFRGPLYLQTNEYLKEYKKTYSDFSIIHVPSSVIQKKIYWSLIVHEIGHILYGHYHLAETFHERMDVAQLHTQDGRNYFHGREFVSDYIASLYCGPVFYESLKEFLGLYEVFPTGTISTHPYRDARLFFLQTYLKGIIDNPNTIDTKPVRDNHELVDYLDKIIEKTRSEVFKNKDNVYQKDEDKMKESVELLKHLIPFIGSPRILLNAYLHENEEVRTTVQVKNKEENIIVIQNKIGRIIEDSIRLSNMKRTFGIMVKA